MDCEEDKPYGFVFGVVTCAWAFLLWLLLQFCVIACVTLLQVVLFLQFWCCCSCDTQTILVVVLIFWVLFFLCNALVFPPSFYVGVVVDATILLFMSLF